MPRFILSVEAEADLIDIYDFTWERWGQRQADTYITALYATFDRLGANPGLGARRSDLHRAARSFPCASHVIFYAERIAGVGIARVLHRSRDFEVVVPAFDLLDE